MDNGIVSILLSDSTAWVVFSFIAFFVLVFVYGRKTILSMLDGKIEKIRSDIANAEKLQQEAELLLKNYQANLNDASRQADEIISKAKRQAEDIRKQAEVDYNETLARREAMLTNRLEQMERTAMEDIRRYAAELAVSATSEIISRKLSSQSANSLVDESIRRVGEKMN